MEENQRTGEDTGWPGWSGLTGNFWDKQRFGSVTDGTSSLKTRSGAVSGEHPPKKTGPVQSPVGPTVTGTGRRGPCPVASPVENCCGMVNTTNTWKMFSLSTFWNLFLGALLVFFSLNLYQEGKKKLFNFWVLLFMWGEMLEWKEKVGKEVHGDSEKVRS
jgi:hypothetical protein